MSVALKAITRWAWLFAVRGPESTPTTSQGRPQTSTLALAKLNGVADRIITAGECTPEHLVALDADAVVIMDCEGCEDALLSPDISATILVELHDMDDPLLSSRVLKRFAGSHKVTTVRSNSRIPFAHPEIGFLSPQGPRTCVIRTSKCDDVGTHPSSACRR